MGDYQALLDISLGNVRLRENEDFIVSSPERSLKNVLPNVEIKIFGVGNAGINILDKLEKAKILGQCYAINTETKSLEKSLSKNKLLLGKKFLSGHGTNGNLELATTIADNEKNEIEKITQNSQLTFVVVGLGKGTGSGIGPKVAMFAKKANSVVIGVAIMPFDFEGSIKQNIAKQALDNLSMSCDSVIVISNQAVFGRMKNSSIKDIYNAANLNVANSLNIIKSMIGEFQHNDIDLKTLKDLFVDGSKAIVGTKKIDTLKNLRQQLEDLLVNPYTNASIVGAKKSIVLIYSAYPVAASFIGTLLTEMRTLSENINHDCIFNEVENNALKENEIEIFVISASLTERLPIKIDNRLERKPIFNKSLYTNQDKLSSSIDARINLAMSKIPTDLISSNQTAENEATNSKEQENQSSDELNKENIISNSVTRDLLLMNFSRGKDA